jgi:hypothetical protein
MKKKLTLILVSIILISFICYSLLVVGNVFLQRTYVSSISSYNSEALSIEETRSKNEDVHEIKKAVDEGFVPVLPPVFFDYPKRIKSLQEHSRNHRFVPLGAQPNANVYYCNEGYGLIKYKSDRYGFRNPDSIWDNKGDSKVLLIGDSFVHGACVNDDHTFRSYISKAYPHTINLGMSGSGPNNYIRTAEYFIKKVKPEKVIIFIFANDNEGRYKTIFSKNFYEDPFYLLEDNKSKDLSRFYNKASTLSLIEKSKPVKRKLHERLEDDFKLEFIRKLLFNKGGVVTDLIDDTISLCSLHLCDPYFVYLPTSQFWRPDSRQDDFRENIRSYLDEEYNLETNFYDATDLIDENRLLYAPKGPHYSNEGYKKISSQIIEMIK